MKKILVIAGIFLFIKAFAQTIDENISKANDYYSIGQYEMAEALYKKALEKEPSNRIAQHNLANALYRQKKYKEATEVLNGIVADSKENTTANAKPERWDTATSGLVRRAPIPKGEFCEIPLLTCRHYS